MFRVLLVGLVACASMTTQHPGPGSDPGKGDGSGSGSANGTFLLEERFDELATGAAPSSAWTTDGSVAVREVPFAQDKSAEISKGAGTGVASLAATFADQHGRVVFEAKVLAHETVGFKAIPYVYDRDGATIASVSFHDGNIEVHAGDNIQAVEPFVPNVWYRVRLVVDTDRDVFDLFVDGVRKLHDSPLRAQTDAVAKVRYYMDSATAGSMLVDTILVYTEASYIGAAPQPAFDPRDFGATGDGTTLDTAAIQAAIDAANGTGGSVVLGKGTFLSGTLSLGSNMTFFIDSSATLLGSTNVADYPAATPDTGNTQLNNCKRSLLYAAHASHVAIDGGGTIDGQGDSFSGAEGTRPMLIWSVLSDHVDVRNLYLKKGAVWSLVSMESDHVRIDNVNVQSNFITHDGIDIVDGTDVAVHHVTVRAGDDAMCLKTGVRRGIDTLTVSDSMFAGDNGGSNGIKFGTGTYGALTNITIEDDYVKDVQYAAMAVESRQGADVSNVAFHRVGFANTGGAFFVYLAQQSTNHPIGDVPKLGSIDGVSFTDIAGTTTSYPHSPHQGSLITGHVFDGATYAIKNLHFTNVAIAFTGGLANVPASPPEASPDQYPESNMFGDLPAWGYYLRHVDGVTFANCTASAASGDARPVLATDDVANAVGSPM